MESIKVSITKSQCDKEEDEKDEENTESRKPKLSLSLTKKTSATSSQSSPSSSFDTKPKPALGKLSTSKKEKNVLEVIKNSQAVPDLTIVKKVNHKKDVVENHTEELDIASNKSLVDKAKDFVVEMKEDLVKNEKENVIMDEKKDLIVIIKEDNEDFLVNNKEDVIIDNNEADTKDTEMQLQNVKIHPRKLTKKWSEKQSMIETESVTANHSSSQSKSDTLNISQTELVSSNEAVKPSTVNTLKDTQTYAKRKFVVLDEKPDVIELSDDDNEDGDLIHTLQLSRKLKRNRISLSKQKR